MPAAAGVKRAVQRDGDCARQPPARILRRFAFAARIADPRWSISLTGAGIVLAVLGVLRIAALPPVFVWLAEPIVGALLFVLTRDVHTALAGLAAAALVLLFTGGVGGALFAVPSVRACLGRAAFRRQGESEALARAIEDQNAFILFAGAAVVRLCQGAGLLRRCMPLAAWWRR